MRAYRLTLYQAGGVAARPGIRSATADAWMLRHHAKACAFITAWNPMSRRHPHGWNTRRQDALRMVTRRHPWLEGCSGYRRWHEHNLLIAADPRWLMQVARRFRQAAILVIPHGQPARLRYR